MRRLFYTFLFLVLSVGQSVCLALTNNFESLIAMNSKDSTTPSTVSSTFCMGRFLIDVPYGSKFNGGNYKYDFVQIEAVKAMPSDKFENEMAGYETTLGSAKNKKTQKSMLLKNIAPEKYTKILASWKVDVSTAQITINGYRWVNGNRYHFIDTVGGSKLELGVDNMQEILARVHPRGDADIPNEPGYCFAGGFIANTKWENEEVSLDIDIAGHPDAFLSVWIYPLASDKHDKPLLERVGGVTQSLGNLATSVHVLRKGSRSLGLYQGQEYLASMPNSGGMRGHAFVWETQGNGTLDTPAIKIELTTGHQDNKGNPQKASFTDQQAMKLWDDILNSFRLRPTGDAVKTSDTSPEPQPRLPLGELAATGRACPQTGWWQASEAGELEGGARQYFTAGETMPQVTMLGESSLWQKLKGARPSYRAATVWKLVDYDAEAPKPQSIAQAAPGSASSDAHGLGDGSSHQDKG